MALSPSRQTAVIILYDVEERGAFVNLRLHEVLSQSEMDLRDRALCTELVMGVLKNRLYLNCVLQSYSKLKLKKLSPWILHILQIGAYSILFLDKIPPSATVNECVALAKRYGHQASAGFVNAVLRALVRGGAPEFKGRDSVEALCIRYSYPRFLVEHFLREQGDKTEAILAGGNQTPPVYVRMCSDELVEDCKRTEFFPEICRYVGPMGPEQTMAYRAGKLTVQDAAAQLAVRVLDPQPEEKILDMCAAPGGKTTHIGQLMNNTGSVTACDIYPHKIDILHEYAHRVHLTNIHPLLHDATKLNKEWVNAFDRVLVDAPCSGFGIIRRKPDIKWKKEAPDVANLAVIQANILDCAAQYVKCGGVLVYSTCTISRKENEDQVAAFLERHPTFKLLPFSDFPVEDGGRGYVQLLPGQYDTDGFFIARFERKR